MLLLRARRDDLEEAGVRPYGISRDSPWSHASWTEALGLERIPLLSDWNGEATRGFGVTMDYLSMADVSRRSAFLITDGVITAAWSLDREMPDVDAIIEAAAAA